MHIPSFLEDVGVGHPEVTWMHFYLLRTWQILRWSGCFCREYHRHCVKKTTCRLTRRKPQVTNSCTTSRRSSYLTSPRRAVLLLLLLRNDTREVTPDDEDITKDMASGCPRYTRDSSWTLNMAPRNMHDTTTRRHVLQSPPVFARCRCPFARSPLS